MEKKMNQEMLECAKVNFENLERVMPMLKANPYYIIAKGQLDDGLGYKPIEQTLEENTPKRD